MTKKFKFLSGTVRAILGSSLLLGILFIMSCDNGGGDDPEPELYQLPGVYTFKKATLTKGKEEIASTLGFPVELIPSDITDQMAGGLLAEAPCTDPENGAVELKANFDLYFTCIGETNEDKAGVWSVNSDTTVLNLNLSVAAGDLPLKIENLVINESTDVISGSIKNFPITKTLLAGFLVGVPGGDVILAGIDDAVTILVDVDIEFQKEVTS